MQSKNLADVQPQPATESRRSSALDFGLSAPIVSARKSGGQEDAATGHSSRRRPGRMDRQAAHPVPRMCPLSFLRSHGAGAVASASIPKGRFGPDAVSDGRMRSLEEWASLVGLAPVTTLTFPWGIADKPRTVTAVTLPFRRQSWREHQSPVVHKLIRVSKTAIKRPFSGKLTGGLELRSCAPRSNRLISKCRTEPRPVGCPLGLRRCSKTSRVVTTKVVRCRAEWCSVLAPCRNVQNPGWTALCFRERVCPCATPWHC